MSIRDRDRPKSQLDVGLDVPADTAVTAPATTNVTIPADGTLTEMTVAWPGLDGGVGARIERIVDGEVSDQNVYLPRNANEEFVAFAEYTVLTFRLDQDVNSGDVIQGSYFNLDATDSHLVTAPITFAEGRRR